MKFADYVTMFQKLGKKTRKPCLDFYCDAIYRLYSIKMAAEVGWAQTELTWYRNSQPYFKLWPAIVPNAVKIKFDINCELLPNPPLPAMLIRLDERFKHSSLRTILFSMSDAIHETLPTNSRQLVVLHQNDGSDVPGFQGLILRPGESVEDVMNRSLHPPSSISMLDGKRYDFHDADSEYEMNSPGNLALKIAIFVMLLAEDKLIIQPDVLSKDRQRFDNSTDPEERQRLIDKARRHGIVVFRVGEQYETIPHYRRPHPALYHVGKGRKEQRIVFRSGCVVHRDKMTKVPTGYITPEGVEVEP